MKGVDPKIRGGRGGVVFSDTAPSTPEERLALAACRGIHGVPWVITAGTDTRAESSSGVVRRTALSDFTRRSSESARPGR